MADTRVIQSKLQWIAVVDPSVQAASNQVTQSIQATLIPMDELTQATTGNIIPMDDLADAAERLKNATNGVDLAKFDQITNGGGIVDDNIESGGFSLTGSRRALTSLGGLAGGSPGLSDAARIVSVGAAFGAVGVAASVAALAVKGYTDSIAASTERAKAFGDALEKAFEGTTTDIQKYIEQTKAQITADTAVRDSLQKLAAAAPPQLATNLDNASQGIANFLENTAGNPENVKPINDASISQEAYNSQVDEYNKKIQLAQIALNAYNAAVGNNVVALNNAAAAAKNADVAFNKLSDQAVNAIVERAHSFEQVQQMTQAQRAEQVTRDLENMAILQAAMDKQDKTTVSGLENYNALHDEWEKLNGDATLLAHTSNTYADQLLTEETAKKAVADATNNYLDAVTKEGEALQAVSKAQQDLAGAATEHSDKVRQIQQDEQEKELADRQKSAQQVEDDTAKHLDRIKDINDQYAQDHEAAVGDRDALANYKAKLADEKALTKEQTSFVTQEKQQATHLAQSLAADQVAEQKSQQAEAVSYSKRQSQLVVSLNNAQVAENRAANLAVAYQSIANQGRQTIENNHQATLATIAFQGGMAVQQVFQQTMNNLVAIASMSVPLTQQQQIMNLPIIQQVVNQQITKVVRGATRIP